MKTNITFIINPVSGTGNKQELPAMIERVLASAAINYEIIFTKYAGHAEEIATEKAKSGVDIVVAVGGDGTVNEVGRALVDTSTALGIIPCGSGNGLARHLGISLIPKKAIELLIDAVPSIIDYGKINNEILFFCSCGVGFDALVSLKFSQANRRGLMSYCNIALRENFNYKPETYHLITDEGAELIDKAFVIACGNAAQYGNDAFIAPHASIQDGLLDVTLIEPIHFIDTPILSYQLFTKKIDTNKKTRTLRSKKVQIIRESEGAMHYDGEPIMAPKNLTIEVVQGGLKVIANSLRKI
ncbi:diacylglycerol/lipid kinase family protein [Bacteroides propionicifaciens]|uniref:diacylglycerol/lipid kinase family protein n=1 Tax=Bacteroides propionicifaciens TaxID=392838 RepID=UPI00036EC555|nr:diacylglycerol kinase family protein [Bacteroides propionicifaciens]